MSTRPKTKPHSYSLLFLLLLLLLLPVNAASFFEPLPTDKATYMARWKALENEVQEVFVCARPIDGAALAHMRNVVFPGLRVGFAAELDATEKTATGSVSFRTGTLGPDGAAISVGAMIRVEADPGQNRYRVTIRAKHPKVSNALKQIVKGHLE
jgi:hypothetical protein